MQHNADVASLTGCQGHLQRRSLVAGNADHILARREVTIKAGSLSDPMHWNAIYGYVVVDVGTKRTDRTKNVEPAHAIGDGAFLSRARLLTGDSCALREVNPPPVAKSMPVSTKMFRATKKRPRRLRVIARY